MSDAWALFDTIIERLDYRGWTFRIDRTQVVNGAPILRVVLRTIDTSDFVTPMPLTHMFILPTKSAMYDNPMSPDDVVQWFMDRVGDIERHERMEWFRVAGDVVFFPDHTWGDSYKMKRISENFLVEVAHCGD